MSLATAGANEDEAMRERRCIVSGEILPERKLIRFVVAPDGTVTPDIAAALPGRGIWVGVDALPAAIARKLFARAAKANVVVPADLAARVEAQLVARLRADLGMARRSGQIALGFDAVARALQSDPPPALLVEASDGSADGKRKLFAIGHARGLKIQIVEPLTSAELSLALGRENVIHAALKSGRLAERLSLDADRLAGLRSPAACRSVGGGEGNG